MVAEKIDSTTCTAFGDEFVLLTWLRHCHNRFFTINIDKCPWYYDRYDSQYREYYPYREKPRWYLMIHNSNRIFIIYYTLVDVIGIIWHSINWFWFVMTSNLCFLSLSVRYYRINYHMLFSLELTSFIPWARTSLELVKTTIRCSKQPGFLS